MRKFLLLFVLMASIGTVSAQRYLSEVFSGVTVTKDVQYAINITVLTGSPTPDTLLCDVYEPTGDTASARPVVMVSHTGSFLPPQLNGQITGDRNDSNLVAICQQFARRGYVAVAYTYRQGWNPASTVQEVRTGTLLNAAYRGIQDSRTLVRFLRSTFAGSNPYKIDTSRFIIGGIGTGGYLSLGTAYLSSFNDINLAKFIDPNTGFSYVDTSLSGGFDGLEARTLNLPNHVNFSSKVHFGFNLGGAVGDSTWIKAGQVPFVSFHVPTDPFAPYDFGAVIVPTTGDFVVNVSGSKGIQRRSTRLGNNTSYQFVYTDAYTAEANTKNDGLDGLYPFPRPTPESGPWEWWDSTIWNQVPHPSGGTFHSVGLLSNPDMSKSKAIAYLDTVQNYLAPRIVCALGLSQCALVSKEEKLAPGSIELFPNPSSNGFVVRSTQSSNTLESVELVDLQGRVVRSIVATRNEVRLDHNGVSPGLYLARIRTADGIVTKKVMLR